MSYIGKSRTKNTKCNINTLSEYNNVYTHRVNKNKDIS